MSVHEWSLAIDLPPELATAPLLPAQLLRVSSPMGPAQRFALAMMRDALHLAGTPASTPARRQERHLARQWLRGRCVGEVVTARWCCEALGIDGEAFEAACAKSDAQN